MVSRCGECAGDVMRGRAEFQTQFRLTNFGRFSPNFEIEMLQTLNTKVAQQVTLYKNTKGSIGFHSPV
jgi:hypothetical protein